MSGTGETEADFGGERRQFRIRLGEIRRIEAKCGNVGVGEVMRRLARCVLVTSKLGGLEALAAGLEIHADDVREPILQGLTAHMSMGEATKLVRGEIDERGTPGLLDNASTALLVLWGARETPPEDPEDEDEPGEMTAGTMTPPNPPTSSTSTASAKRSGSRR